MKSNTNFTTDEIFNAENSTKESYTYEEYPSSFKNKAMIFKYTIVFVVIVTITLVASLLFQQKSEAQLNAALYQETAKTIDTWMDDFADIGNNTLEINHDNAVTQNRTNSIALSTLQSQLHQVHVQTPKGLAYLKNVNVVLKKGKSYEIVDVTTGKPLNPS